MYAEITAQIGLLAKIFFLTAQNLLKSLSLDLGQKIWRGFFLPFFVGRHRHRLSSDWLLTVEVEALLRRPAKIILLLGEH